MLLEAAFVKPDVLQHTSGETHYGTSGHRALSEKKEHLIGTCRNLAESPENYAQ